MHAGCITVMKSNSKPVPLATIMTELFRAAEHEQSGFNIACSKITALSGAETHFKGQLYAARDHLKGPFKEPVVGSIHPLLQYYLVFSTDSIIKTRDFNLEQE